MPKKCVGVELIAIFNPGVSASRVVAPSAPGQRRRPDSELAGASALSFVAFSGAGKLKLKVLGSGSVGDRAYASVSDNVNHVKNL